MEVRSHGPLRVGWLLWQSPRGGWVLTVVAKATFDLGPTTSRLSDRQDLVHEDDLYEDADPSRSLRSPSDLAPFKPRADVIVVGHAFTPRSEPARSVVARVQIGELDKSIELVADRWLKADGSIEDGEAFTKMPLRYERAAGGPETWNPVGVRADARDKQGRIALPNLQPPGIVVNGPGDFIDPIGFGPFAESWWGRRGRLGRHAKRWN
jgi:hypothetical protein